MYFAGNKHSSKFITTNVKAKGREYLPTHSKNKNNKKKKTTTKNKKIRNNQTKPNKNPPVYPLKGPVIHNNDLRDNFEVHR